MVMHTEWLDALQYQYSSSVLRVASVTLLVVLYIQIYILSIHYIYVETVYISPSYTTSQHLLLAPASYQQHPLLTAEQQNSNNSDGNTKRPTSHEPTATLLLYKAQYVRDLSTPGGFSCTVHMTTELCIRKNNLQQQQQQQQQPVLLCFHIGCKVHTT